MPLVFFSKIQLKIDMSRMKEAAVKKGTQMKNVANLKNER